MWKWIAFAAAMAAAGIVAYFYVNSQAALKRQGELLLAAKADTIPDDPELYAAGQKIGEQAFGQNCVSCHGATLQGDTRQGVPNLSDDDWLYGGGFVSEIEKTITYGIRTDHPETWNLASMPAFASENPYSVSPTGEGRLQLTQQEIADVTEYVLTLSEHEANADAAMRGEDIWNDKGGCYDCHAQDGFGDPAIGAPNLTDKVWLRGAGTREDIHKAVAEGDRGICPAWVTKLDAITIRAIAVYIKSRSKVNPYAVAPEEVAPGGT